MSSVGQQDIRHGHSRLESITTLVDMRYCCVVLRVAIQSNIYIYMGQVAQGVHCDIFSYVQEVQFEG